MKTNDSKNVKRRSFLKSAAVGTVAVGSGALTAGANAEQLPAQKTQQNKGYRETKHIREYYRLARF